MRAVSVLLAACCVLAGCDSRPETEWVRADGKTTHALEALHGTGPDDVWAVGALGTIIHWDGTSWSVMDTGTSVDLHAVWAVGPKEAWAVGEQGLVLRWDGTRWSRVNVGTDKRLTSVWASGPADVWLAVSGSLFNAGPLHFDGTAWSQRVFPGSVTDAPGRVWGRGPNDVWVTLEYGEQLMHWTGSGWSAETPEVGSYPRCEELGAGGAGELLALCEVLLDKRVVLKGADGWKALPMDEHTLDASSDWNGVWSSGGSLWAVGNFGRVHRFDGKAWLEELGMDVTLPRLNDVWGSSEADVWAVGNSGLVVRRKPVASP
jgi:hypothetical protein